nr:glucan endo-1,3-beta-glucosidase 11-like [Ipomoea batatas]
MEPQAFFFTSQLPLFFSVIFWPVLVSSIGINYGQIANNLPSPENVVPLVKSMGVTRLKLYDADPKVLKAFANTNVEFIVSVTNNELCKVKDPERAEAWVRQNVQAYLPATKITCIAVGNEVLSSKDASLANYLLPAMYSVHAALVKLNLEGEIDVTTTHSLAVLESSYPPSSGAFKRDLVDCVCEILKFHVKTGSPFLINAYPYFAYKAHPNHMTLDFVLFQQNQGITDPVSNLHYDNMLFAQIDAVHWALSSLGYKNVCVQISETGWPSKGDADEPGATLENARKYNCNLLKLIAQKKGTPLKPTNNLNIFVFALFNENMKPGPTSERNYGLFNPDGTPAYPLGFSGTTNPNSNSTVYGPPSGFPPSISSPPGTPSDGYLSITSEAVDISMLSGETSSFMQQMAGFHNVGLPTTTQQN